MGSGTSARPLTTPAEFLLATAGDIRLLFQSGTYQLVRNQFDECAKRTHSRRNKNTKAPHGMFGSRA
jgi:hypothetical protein